MKTERTINFAGPKGIVSGIFTGFRIMERPADGLVHFRNNESDQTCTACGHEAVIWVDQEWRHQRHPARCTEVMDVPKAAAA